MKKASTSRSQRGNKGIKGKHVLQICVLLGVCIWLIYQVKYSHDKKKEFFEKDIEKETTVSVKADGLVKLGRKDLLPGYHNTEKELDEEEEEKEISTKSKVVEEEEKEVEEDEEDESKQGEEVAEEEEEEDKSKQGEEEDGEEDKHEEDEIDEQDKESNRGDEIDMTVDEAREEHYKADDASSAVVSHESRVLNTQKLKESSENSTVTAHENHTNVTTSVVVVEVKTEPELKPREDNNSQEAVLEASGILKKETEIMRERSQEQDKAEEGSPPYGSSRLIQEESKNSTSEYSSSSSLIENISGSNTTNVEESSKSKGDDETESSNLSSTEETEEGEDDTSILQEEREALTDPQTLPDIQIGGKEEEDEEEAMAAE